MRSARAHARFRLHFAPATTAAALSILAVCAIALLAHPTALAAPANGTTGLGMLNWSFATGGPVRSTPVIWNDLLIAASTDGHVYALDRETGDRVWRYDAGAPIAATPAVGPRHVFVIDRTNTVHAIRADNGSGSWLRETGPDMPLPWGLEGWDYVVAGPRLADGTLFVGSGAGGIYALDPADGSIRWHVPTGGRIRATPTIHDDTLYVGSGDGIFYALNTADGSTRWTFTTLGAELDPESTGFDQRQIYSEALVADGMVYFGSRDAQLYALEAATGDEVWRTDDGTAGWVIAAPHMHQGQLMETRSSSTRVRALDPMSGNELWGQVTGNAVFAATVSAGDDMIAVGGVGLIIAYDTAGNERWRHSVGSGIWAEPAVYGGVLYFGADDGKVRAYSLEDRPMPYLRVFHDDDLARRSALGNPLDGQGRPASEHVAVRNYFTRRGYRALDGETLPEFLEARTADRVPSVVVFAVDGWQPSFEGGETSLLRRYLEAGGRAVWMGHAPGFLVWNDEGQVTGVDRDRPTAALGVDHGEYNTDIYGVWPTAEGQRRGLDSWWVSGTRASDVSGVTVLARNEIGGVVAWLKEFASGGQFLNLYYTIDQDRLDEIRAVAEYGIYRSPHARHVEASPSR